MGIELGRISGPLLARDLIRKNSGVGEENLAFETDLLYLDVINGRIGVQTDNPQTALGVNGTTRSTNYKATTSATLASLSVSTNRIVNPFAGINGKIIISPDQASDPIIQGPRFETLNLGLDDKVIENFTLNSDINFNPTGTGRTQFTTSELFIDGNLTVTGSATWDGSLITIGSSNSDNVIFNADINSNIVPETNELWSLGTSSQRWNKTYVKDVITTNLTVSNSYFANNVDLILDQGNTLYVSINGNDAYIGTHEHATYRTIKHALSQATAGDTVVIFPGTYEEIFPLTVPAGVSVNGAGIRAVTVKPTVGTINNNAFLLNGESTVSHLTVKDFNNGYAFSFASGFTVTSRSPYVQNITVITTGPSAGNGALADGSLANSASREASLLFHSVTFIVPGATGVHATNGARVEWLNSFTYFANRGIYLTEGTLGFASQGTKFGAELRSIGSANVYGTYGAVADGASTLAYLISHNFAYTGTGIDTTNDPKLVTQANEVVELNDGRIFYESVDHKGDFRIGNIFYVNQETGAVVFDAQAITFSPTGSISLEGPTSNAYIDYSVVQVGNIRVYNNNIDSIVGPVNFLAFSGSTYLNTDVYVTGNTIVSADIAVDGNLFLGNQASDTITIFPNLTQDLLPDNVGGPFALGTDSKRWNTLYSTLLDIDGVTQITSNTISTLTTDTDLIISAAGTGIVKVTNTDVTVSNNLFANSLTINGATEVRDVETNGIIQHTGNWNQTGNTDIIGLFANNNIEIKGASFFEIPGIKLYQSEILGTSTNSNLSFQGAGTGSVIIDQRLRFKDSTLSNNWSSPTTDTQKSIIFAPNGTGNVAINSNKALVIPVGSTATRTIGIGEIRYNSVTNLIEGGGTAGLISFNGLYDSDRNTYIRAGAVDNILYFGINNTENVTLDTSTLKSPLYHIDNISLTSNTISNRITNNDLIFSPNGTGNTVLNNIGFGAGGNLITNFSTGALVLASTGAGYYKFAGTGALNIPTGGIGERRLDPEVGETRFNTDENVTEVYSGDPLLGDSGWIPAIGTSGEISAQDVLNILEVWTLILG